MSAGPRLTRTSFPMFLSGNGAWGQWTDRLDIGYKSEAFLVVLLWKGYNVDLHFIIKGAGKQA